VRTWMSERIALTDKEEAVEFFYQKGWTDGLPIIPPTPDKVEAMLQQVSLQGNEIFGTIPERQREINAEKVAINAVMAGCLPAYMPVVAAAVQAVLEPVFGAHGVTSSTSGAAILLIVNGPIVREIGLNSGKNLLGTGNRANATIGRAVRLVLQNAGGTALFDQSTIGHPGKFSFCMAEAENEEWVPLNVERGFKREESTVTVFAVEGPNQINNHVAETPEGILMTIADRIASMGRLNMQRPLPQTPSVVVVCPEHMSTLLKHEWDKKRVKQFLYDHARRPKTDLYHFGQQLEMLPNEDGEWIHMAPSPEHIFVVAGGGTAGRFSACIPAWGNIRQSTAVTKRISDSGLT
jgi:hypothetical protein